MPIAYDGWQNNQNRMLITCIELQSTKSYRDQTIEFAEGTTAICGENGAGKSTLLEAIGFALFNYLPYRQEDFVRQGQSSGCVTVHFVSGKDGRRYQVVRRFGKSPEQYIYDPELKRKIVSGHKDVLDWLKEHMGLEGTADPALLFCNAIGVPQGLLTTAFLQRPSERKPIFDRLLQVDDFERVYQELREARNYLKDCVSEVRVRIAALEERGSRLPELENQADMLSERVAEIGRRLEEIKTELGPVIKRREELEELKQQLDALEQDIEQLEIQLRMTGEQLEATEIELEKSEEAARIAEACHADYEAYQNAKKQLDLQEEKRRERDNLLEAKRALEHQIALKQDRLGQLETSLREAEEAAERMKALHPLFVRYEELERKIQKLGKDARELDFAQKQLQKLRDSTREIWKKLKVVKEDLKRALNLESELQVAEQELVRAREDKSAAEQQQSVLQAETERLEKQIVALEAAEAAICPVCEQPLSAAHRDELLARNRAQIEEMSTQYRLLDQHIAELSEQIREREDRCADLRLQLRRLPGDKARLDLIEQLVRLRAERAQWCKRLAELENTSRLLQAAEDELGKLGDPRGEYHRLSGIAQKREATVQQIEFVQREVEDLQGKLTRVEAELLPYAGLDAMLTQLRAQMAKLEPNYRRFLERSPLANMLPKWQSEVERLKQGLQDLESRRRQSFEERDKVAEEFDPDELEALHSKEERLKGERSRLEGELEILKRQLRQVKHEIGEIERAREELQQAQGELKQIEHTEQVIEFMRNVIHKAGPYMVRLVAARVSAAATKIFRDIMADPTLRLHWREDYGIVLEADGRERDFEQLSGGEQMAAALAVRLALLRELSSVDVAFFDEPTSNLDSTRRENLAEQIAAIRNTGLSQLFIISHDDTFEEVTDHVVRVRKEHGESIVETR